DVQTRDEIFDGFSVLLRSCALLHAVVEFGRLGSSAQQAASEESVVFIGADHGGFALKEVLTSFLREELRIDVVDLGIDSKDPADYPDIAERVCGHVLGERGLGILICGTGIGISIAANKVKGIRCALCSEE